MHKTIDYKKKYTRYDEKNEIRRKSKKYLGQYHRLFYISLYSRKILYTNFFEKTLAYYTWKMYYYASKPHDMPDESREWTEKERQIFRDSFFNGNTLLPIKGGIS